MKKYYPALLIMAGSALCANVAFADPVPKPAVAAVSKTASHRSKATTVGGAAKNSAGINGSTVPLRQRKGQ